MFLNFKNHKTRYILAILAALLFIIGTAIHLKRSETSDENDFRVYYKTSLRIADKNWEEVYTRADGPMPYRYVPYTLPMITWLKNLNEMEARKAWLLIQALGFAVGFYYIYRALILLKAEDPILLTSLTFILSFRYYLDSLYSGQIAGIIFCSFSMGLYYYLRKKMVTSALINFLPTSLKIGPGINLVHILIKTRGFLPRIKVLLAGILLFLILCALTFLWISYQAPGSDVGAIFTALWKNWVMIVTADGDYYDGSTAKSQALRSVILRVLGKEQSSEVLWKIMVLLGVAVLCIKWMRTKTTTLYQDAYSYSLGIMAIILFMPQALPYKIMNVAIPLAIFISHSKIKTNRFHKLVLIGFVVFLTLPSSDFIGRWTADEIQALSLPFLVLAALSVVAYKES